jgi:homocysteine S-methyltransferase
VGSLRSGQPCDGCDDGEVHRSLTDALDAGVVLLDGGLATELESRGHDLSSDLWSARLLAESPDEIAAVHAAYFAAGARVATTASYQASYEGLAATGHDRAAADVLLERSVELARAAAEEAQDRDPQGRPRWVAASVGPYGAMLAGGQEYTGEYGTDVDVTALRTWHRPRMEVLAAAGPDLLALETVPSLAEAEALLAEADALGVPAWLSLTCDGLSTRRGEDVTEAFAMARDVEAIVAVGVNCTRPRDVAALADLAGRVSGKPVVAYPNSGESWDGAERVWTGTPGFSAAEVGQWLAAGARLVGGCCRVGPAEIAELAELTAAQATATASSPGRRDGS